MAITLSTDITHSSKSRVSNPQFHPGFNELNDNYNSRNNRRNNHHNIWISITIMEWRQRNPFLCYIRRNSRFRFGFQYDNSWFRLLFGDSNKSSKSSTVSNRNRKRNRHYFYYSILISLLSVAPVRAEGETNNTSNPVAAATGNVTNQAVQFQNNGAPSRQVMGPNISCNGSTMTFSPFYMGNHTTPFDEEMAQKSYTVAENWGFQINFMVPLDDQITKRCKSIAAKQEQKMSLDYELVRIKNCAELQQKGFMLLPGSRIYNVCSDVIPIAAYKKAQDKVLLCASPKPWWKPWHNPNKQVPCPLKQ